VGPARGFAFSEDDEEGFQLLESILAIDESHCLREGLPPRHGVGVFAHGNAGPMETIGQAWSTGNDSDSESD
jgi:hypothetical protein